jgi:hypothetical protein
MLKKLTINLYWLYKSIYQKFLNSKYKIKCKNYGKKNDFKKEKLKDGNNDEKKSVICIGDIIFNNEKMKINNNNKKEKEDEKSEDDCDDGCNNDDDDNNNENMKRNKKKNNKNKMDDNCEKKKENKYYVIENHLGKGGFADVYECCDCDKSKKYAIKILKSSECINKAGDFEVRTLKTVYDIFNFI